MRVPRKTQALLRTSGRLSTAVHCDQSNMYPNYTIARKLARLSQRAIIGSFLYLLSPGAKDFSKDKRGLRARIPDGWHFQKVVRPACLAIALATAGPQGAGWFLRESGLGTNRTTSGTHVTKIFAYANATCFLRWLEIHQKTL
jgi:hypothetical protein